MEDSFHLVGGASSEAVTGDAPKKLWLWQNFVDGRPEYWAFDNPYPTRLDCGDPQTLGEPCGYAIFKPSRDGSRGRTEESVIATIKRMRAEEAADGAPQPPARSGADNASPKPDEGAK